MKLSVRVNLTDSIQPLKSNRLPQKVIMKYGDTKKYTISNLFLIARVQI